jgi:hypothetical protein
MATMKALQKHPLTFRNAISNPRCSSFKGCAIVQQQIQLPSSETLTSSLLRHTIGLEKSLAILD